MAVSVNKTLCLALILFANSLATDARAQAELSASHDKPSPFSDTTHTPADSQSGPLLIAAALGAELLKQSDKALRSDIGTLPADDNSLRLLEIHIGKYRLDELISAYQSRDYLYIPLGALAEIIELAITANPDNGIAEGFILREDRTFYLDATRGEVTIAGKLTAFDRTRVAMREFDDIYVDADLINQWFPLKLDIDLYASRLKVISKEPLPLEQRKLREEKFAVARSQTQVVDRGYPQQIDPYQNWTYPFINQSIQIGAYRDADDEISGTFDYSTYVTADLLQMESTWYLAGNEDDIVDDVRVTFSRKDPAGNLLGVARATEYAFGNVLEPRFELVTRPLDPQPGLYISNYPLARQTLYDSHSFRGDLPPGWQVELYRNNSLLEYQPAAIEGQYRFDDVPLLYGNNYFRLLFYGPQGQQREETYNFTLDDSLTEPGKHHYRALLSTDENSGSRSLLQYDVGINKQLSLAASFASIPIDEELLIDYPAKNHNYLSAGVRGFLASMFYRADFIDDTESGSAINWNIQTRLGEFILDFGEDYFIDEFISEEFPQSYQPIERRTFFNIDTAIPASVLPRIPVTFELQRDQREGDIIVDRFANRISFQQNRLAVSNTINLNSQTGLDTIVSDSLQISQRAYGYNFRGAFNYEFAPNSGLNSATFTVDGFRLARYNISTGFTRVVRNDTDQLLLNMNRSHGTYSLGLNTSYSTGGVFTVNLSFQMGLGREPRSGIWHPEYRPIASQGSLSAQAYLDTNGNGSKDTAEEGLPGVKIRINGGNVPQQTSDAGIVYVTGIEPYRELDVDLAVETLEDPLWQPAVKGKRMHLRPGYVALVDFPIIVTGEIDGTAFVQLGDEQREVSGVIVELLDTQGNIVQTTKTAFDGFYLFSKIPAGKYQLRISRDQTDSLNLMPVKPTFVVIEAENPIVNGMDFVLQKKFSTD